MMNVYHVDSDTLEKFGILNQNFFNFFKASQFDEAWALSDSINVIFEHISHPPVYQHPQGLSFDTSASVSHYFSKPDEQWLPAWKKGGFFDFIVVNCSHEALKEFITHPEANLEYNNSRQCSIFEIREKIHVDKYYDYYRFFKDNQALFSPEQQSQIQRNFIHASMVYGAEKVFFDAFNTQKDESFYFTRLIQRYPGSEVFLGNILANRPTFLNDKQYHEALYLYVAYHLTPALNANNNNDKDKNEGKAFSDIEPLLQSLVHYDEEKKQFITGHYMSNIMATMLNQFDAFKPHIVSIFNILEEQNRYDLITSIGRSFFNDVLLSRHVLLKGLHSDKSRMINPDDYSMIEQASFFLGHLSEEAFQAFIDYGKTISHEPMIDGQSIVSYLSNDKSQHSDKDSSKKIALFYQCKKQLITKISQYRKILADTEEQAQLHHADSQTDNDLHSISRLKI